MSHRATTWAWSLDLTPSAKKIVLLALADFADEANSCYPGQTRLAEMTGQSVESVRRHIKALEDEGLLSRDERRRPDGSRTSDRYVLPVNLTGGTTGQSALHLPGNLPTPTGQSEGARTGKKNLLEEPPSPGEAGQGSTDAGFEAFWKLYPRRTAKGQAIKAWRSATKKASVREIIDGLVAQLGQLSMQKRPEGDFRPYPATWLNGECWADELDGGTDDPKRDGNGRIREW